MPQHSHPNGLNSFWSKPDRMIKIGITGGIGSGKSVVASLLELTGTPIYIADTESKQLTDTSPIIRQKLIALFGSNLYTPMGLDRQKLATYIFNNPENLKQVNAIIHPEVNRHFSKWTSRQKTACCAIESAILFESGFNHIVDITLMVYAPTEVRIQRALERDTASREEIVRRINNQMPDEDKKEQCDYVIINDGRRAIIPQVYDFQSYIRNNTGITL